MTTPAINRLFDNVRIRAPGVIDDTIKLEFYNVLKELFDDSNCWFEDVPVPVTSGVTDYVVTPTGVCQIVRLYGVLDADDHQVNATYLPPDTLQLFTAPSLSSTYTARLILTVIDPATRDGYPVFPEWVLEAYSDEIMDGILGRLFSQIAKPYSNERMAIYHMRRFRGGVARARVDAQRKYTYRAQAWRFPQSFARRRAR